MINRLSARWAAFALFLLGAGALATRAQDEGQDDAPPGPRTATTTTAPATVAPGYFLFPVAPGQPGFLAANMGEIRPNHFHGGLDIKTASAVNRPIYASADGWVSRLKQSSYGYGNVLYITHPNGLTTVYGHLNEFRGPVLAELRRRQYEKQTYELELFFDKNQFPVRRGEVVALSGNTGGSFGPHLHWEVRDGQDRQLNPLQWGGFPEVQDHLGPVPLAVGVEPLGIASRVRGRFARALLSPRTQPLPGARTVLPDTVPCSGTVGLLLQGFDRFDHAWNKNGIQRVRVRVNGRLHYQHVIDRVPFPLGSRQVNNFVDYAFEMQTRRALQKLWVDEGNDLPFYTPAGPGAGRLTVAPGQVYTVDIEMADSYQNTASVQLVLRGEEPAPGGYERLSAAPAAAAPRLRYDLSRNLLRAVATQAPLTDSSRPQNLVVRRGGRQLRIRPSYSVGAETTYLYDLRAGLPDSLRLGRAALAFDRPVAVPAGQETHYVTPHLSLLFGPQTLFSTFYLRPAYQPATAAAPETWTLGPLDVPLYGPLRLTLKPARPVPEAERPRWAIYQLTPRGGRAYVGGVWNEDGTAISVPVRALGTFRLYADTKPPEARLLGRPGGQVLLRAGDDLSGLGSYRLLVGGRFRLLRFEHKNNTLFTLPGDTLGPPLRGPAELRLTDQAGNERVVELRL